MSRFKDSTGREWSLDLNVGMLGKLRTDAGFELGKSQTAERLAETLFADPETLAKVLWVLVESQADAKQVTPESFACSLDGDALEVATTAILEAIIDFFHRAGPRAMLRSRLPEMLHKADTQVMQAIESEMSRRTEGPLNPGAGSLPASSASTPAN